MDTFLKGVLLGTIQIIQDTLGGRGLWQCHQITYGGKEVGQPMCHMTILGPILSNNFLFWVINSQESNLYLTNWKKFTSVSPSDAWGKEVKNMPKRATYYFNDLLIHVFRKRRLVSKLLKFLNVTLRSCNFKRNQQNMLMYILLNYGLVIGAVRILPDSLLVLKLPVQTSLSV